MALALKGRVAVITGGSSGLGAAAVELFSREGARVVIADLVAPAAQAADLAASVRFTHCDVTVEADIAAALAFAEREFGGVDVLLNNVGAAGSLAPIADLRAEDWDATMALCLRSCLLGIKHVVPYLRRRGGGSIINTASIAGMRPGISGVAYSVAKAAVIHLTRMAAVEFATDRIRVNALCPGIIPTPAVASYFGVPPEKAADFMQEVAALFGTAQPITRAGLPRDIAQTALFLASDASAFTTGQEFVIDGGMLLKGPASLEIGSGASTLDQILALAQRMRS